MNPVVLMIDPQRGFIYVNPRCLQQLLDPLCLPGFQGLMTAQDKL